LSLDPFDEQTDQTGRLAPSQPQAGKPLERAQLIWRRAVQLADPAQQLDRSAVTLHMLSAAGYNITEMAHALTLGRTHLLTDVDDLYACRAVRILERSIAFLGAKPDTR
jgi:hypothetical protein